MRWIEWLKEFLLGIGTEERTVDYVCGNGDALPLPLSAEEEGEMVRLLGVDEEKERAKTELIQRNLRLVVYIARKFDNTGVDNDDLVSIGTIGLIKAINSFRSDKNIKLATYASRCIENEILMYLRRTARLKSEVSFDEPLNTDFDGNELLLSDVLGTSADAVYGDIESVFTSLDLGSDLFALPLIPIGNVRDLGICIDAHKLAKVGELEFGATLTAGEPCATSKHLTLASALGTLVGDALKTVGCEVLCDSDIVFSLPLEVVEVELLKYESCDLLCGGVCHLLAREQALHSRPYLHLSSLQVVVKGISCECAVGF